MARMLAAPVVICNRGRGCSCNPSPKAVKHLRRSLKRRERRAWKKDAAA